MLCLLELHKNKNHNRNSYFMRFVLLNEIRLTELYTAPLVECFQLFFCCCWILLQVIISLFETTQTTTQSNEYKNQRKCPLMSMHVKKVFTIHIFLLLLSSTLRWLIVERAPLMCLPVMIVFRFFEWEQSDILLFNSK